MRTATKVAVGGIAASVVGAGLLFWGWRRAAACTTKMHEEGTVNPFDCVSAGAPLMVGGAVLGGLGLLTGVVAGGVALVQSAG